MGGMGPVGEGQGIGPVLPTLPSWSFPPMHPGTNVHGLCVTSSSDKRVPVPMDSTRVIILRPLLSAVWWTFSKRTSEPARAAVFSL